MPKLWYPNADQLSQIRVLENENSWFRSHQQVLLAMANTDFGRDLLCIPKEYPRIVKFRKNCVHWVNPDGTYGADFRCGAKWGNVIRSRWEQFNSYLRYFAHSDRTWNVDLSPLTVYARTMALSTLTAYPDPHPESTTVDGSVFRLTDNQTWAGIHDGAGTHFDDTATGDNVANLQDGTNNNTYRQLVRAVFLFDTSGIGAGQTISAATMSLFGLAQGDALSITPNINIYTSTPNSNTALQASDYANFGSTDLSTSITYAGFSTSAYNDFALNGTGLAAISTSAVTKLASRNQQYDAANSQFTTTNNAANNTSYLQAFFADETGTGTDPKLVVTYAPTATTSHHLLLGMIT